MLASARGYLDQVQYLIRQRADPNIAAGGALGDGPPSETVSLLLVQPAWDPGLTPGVLSGITGRSNRTSHGRPVWAYRCHVRAAAAGL
eukprot:COSAG01_NODE_1052_length_11920_cov_6.553760_10_plen_88_part_00